MCIFSGAVQSVSSTRIFARNVNGIQALVYQMKFAAASELAMILPIPIEPSSTEQSVKWIDLSGEPDFFAKLDAKFMGNRKLSRGADSMSFGGAKGILQVHNVGDFQASFVPTLDDMDRLDPRFKLPRETWNRIPAYADYGFAVFKLNTEREEPRQSRVQMPQSSPTRTQLFEQHARRVASPFEPKHRRGDPTEPHPMAFTFASRWPTATFFPTVHIHDGQVHPTEHFDHSLYAQVRDEETVKDMLDTRLWEDSEVPLQGITNTDIISPERRGYKARLEGNLSNVDVILR